MALFEDQRPALAEVVQLAFDAGCEDTDKGADYEDAADGDAEHGEEEEGVAGVAAHGAGVEGAEEATPEIADEIPGWYINAVVATQEGPEKHNHEGHHDYHYKRNDTQPHNQGRRTPRQSIVEGVTQALANVMSPQETSISNDIIN